MHGRSKPNEYDAPVVTPLVVDNDKVLGLDYKSDGLYCDSNGHCCEKERFFARIEKRLRKAQQKLSRMEYRSKNYEKQRVKVAKLHRYLANFRKDFLHKESAAIAKQYDYVCVEDVNMRAMSNKGFGNGKATMDNGYGMLRTFLGYKLAAKGGALIKVDKWYPSSQLCSNCGQRYPEMKGLSIRTFSCGCGYTADRDYNAALNIKKEGLRILKTA